MHSVIISSIICLHSLLYHLLKQCLVYWAIQDHKSEHRTTDAKQRWFLIKSIYMPLYRWNIKEGFLTFQSPEVKHWSYNTARGTSLLQISDKRSLRTTWQKQVSHNLSNSTLAHTYKDEHNSLSASYNNSQNREKLENFNSPLMQARNWREIHWSHSHSSCKIIKPTQSKVLL